VKFFLVFSLWHPGGHATAPARANDPWFGRDKLAHFAVSAIIQSAAHSAFRSRGASYGSASLGAAGVTAAAGIGKELWDLKRRDDFSFRDLAWDGIGGTTGAVLVRQIDR